MFCESERELLLFHSMVEERGIMDEFQKYYLNLAVWCYCNHPEEYKKVIENSERMQVEFRCISEFIEDENKQLEKLKI